MAFSYDADGAKTGWKISARFDAEGSTDIIPEVLGEDVATLLCTPSDCDYNEKNRLFRVSKTKLDGWTVMNSYPYYLAPVVALK